MFRLRTELELCRAFVSNRSNFTVKYNKVLSIMMNTSLMENSFGTQQILRFQRLCTGSVTRGNVIDESLHNERKCVGTTRETDCAETPVNDIQTLKSMLKNILECRNQHISSWLIEERVHRLCESYGSISEAIKNEFLEELTDCSISQHLWLFNQIGKLENGARYLVNLREDLINLIAKKKDERGGCPKLHELNATLREVLSIWFSNHFLELERITSKSSSEILEKISKYERVHPVRNWTDLRRRVGPYRRCFVFLHRNFPGEPIIIIHVALTGEISSNITDILAQDVDSQPSSGACDATEDPEKIKAAVFYSLSLAQKGLNGTGLSYYLIRHVAQTLHTEFPGIVEFSTLSPIHQFKIWFLYKLENGHNDMFSPEEKEKLKDYFGHSNYLEQIDKVLSSNTWFTEEKLRNLLQEPLMRLCARYLYLEKTPRGHAIDGTANLHLKNGAVMWRLNWRANPYTRGLNSSFGIMVNYRYYLGEMEMHGTEYQEQKKITASQQIIELAKSAQKLMLNQSVKSKI